MFILKNVSNFGNYRKLRKNNIGWEFLVPRLKCSIPRWNPEETLASIPGFAPIMK
jgi:hypothetical protein